MVIKKLKERIKSISENIEEDKIKQELEEIETINIELDHKVTTLIAENEHLKQTYKQLYDSIKSLQKVLVITTLKDKLRKLKGKAVVDEAVILHPIDPELPKVNVAPLVPKLRNNRTAHSEYLKHTQEETATLREIVGHERSLNPLNTSLDYACKYTKRIQELFIIIRQTCPCINDLGVNLSTSVSGSQPSGNTKKDKIQNTASVQTFKSNVNSDLQCVTCNGCLFSDNHDLCVLEFINNVNARVKSKSVKKTVKRKIWKLTGKVFTNIGYIWRHTGRTFIIVGNDFPLTRITTTAKVPLRKPIALESNQPKPVVTLVYSQKPKESRNNVLVSKSKINKSLSANKKEPNKSWGSTVESQNCPTENKLCPSPSTK
nr:hypothetical protein [Tanacetum cinerariifolium]